MKDGLANSCAEGFTMDEERRMTKNERRSHPDVRPQRTDPLLEFTGSSLVGPEAQDVEIELLHGCLARCPYVDVLEVEEASLAFMPWSTEGDLWSENQSMTCLRTRGFLARSNL